MKLDFGKHKGEDIVVVAAEDPGYIFWMAEKGVMEIPEHIMELASKSKASDYPEPDFEMAYGDDWGDKQ